MAYEMHNISQQSNAGTNSADSTKLWIDWQLNQYFSLATQTSPSDFHSKYRGGQRHWWAALADHWLNKPICEAADDIIVHFAKDEALYQSLHAISRNPTTQLISVRKKIRVGKPLEMDAICLRDLEQKPGSSILEKVAAVPRVLSLHRTHSYETLENRIYIYVLAALIERAKSYLHDNHEFEHSRRVQDVKNFLISLERIASQTSHFNCLLLQPSLAILPNNSLLYDRNYNVIWLTFRRLLYIERASQEALHCQHTLWKETGRQLLGSILSSRMSKCRALAGSCAYIKRDMQDGRWTEHCSFPGPFQWDRYQLSFVDIWDPEADSYETRILEDLQADQLLIASRTGRPQKLAAIWYYHKSFDEHLDVAAVMDGYGENLEEISNTIGYSVKGLIIGSATLGSAVTLRHQKNLIYISFPADFSLQHESMLCAIQQALEFFLEDQ